MMNIQLPSNPDIFKDEQGISFPIPNVPFVYIRNGSPIYEQFGGVLYLGGWGIEKSKFESSTLMNHALGFRLYKEKRKGVEFQTYITPYLWVAPLKGRTSWVNKTTGERAKKRFPSARLHTQVFAAIAKQTDSGLEFASWAILSATGYQVGFLRAANKKFATETAALRGDINATFFYKKLGFEVANFREVGSGANTSEINPVDCLVIPNSESELGSAYVGKEILEQAAQIISEGMAWFDAWANLPDDPSGYAPTAVHKTQEDEIFS